jgi:hypothetical protein
MNIDQLTQSYYDYNVDISQNPCAVAIDAEALMLSSMDSEQVEQSISELAAACTMCETVQCDFLA